MACDACGDKPKNESKYLPKAVVEINNPESLVLLRKVVIPASMGDDTELPPVVGKYYNVLLHYDANGRNYIYSSDGIPTALDAEVPPEIYERIEDLEEGLSKEILDRGNADTALDTRITNLDNSLATVAKTGSYADLTNKPTIGNGTLTIQKNSSQVGTFTANATGNTTINISVPTKTSELTNNGSDNTSTYVEADDLATVATTGSYNDLLNKPTIDSSLSKTSTNAVRNSAVSTALDNSVMTGLTVSANTSTTTVQLDGANKNLYSGATSTANIPLPVASTTQAGVMNSSTYDAVTNNTNNLNAIMNGAVAITGIAASPSQSDLTTAWQTETGLSTLINRASIYDVDNNKVWTYYTNDTTWHAASNTSQVTINTFTNSSEGTIKGSTNVGQVFAENDGTGSVNGWDTLSSSVSTNTGNITNLQTAVAGKQDALTAGSNISISAQNVISATDTTYTAGTNVSISPQNVISATDTTYTAGNAIDITSNVISADIYPADFFTADNVVSGEGSVLNLTNTIGATLESLQIGGDTKQTTYSGKNLFNINASQSPNARCVATINGESITITSTVDSTGYYCVLIPNSDNLLGETVTLSVKSVTTNTNARIYINQAVNTSLTSVSDSVSSISSISSGTSVTKTFTFPNSYASGKNCFVITFYVSVNGASTVVGDYSTYSDIQLELGDQATSFEPYVGGIASPNPDYPQDVNVVTGEQTIKISGKNLLDVNMQSWSASDVTVANNNDQTLTISGENTSANAVYPAFNRSDADRFYIEAGKTYILSIPNVLPVDVSFRTHSINQRLMNITAGDTMSATWTAQEDDYGWVFCTVPSGVAVDFTTGAQIEEVAVDGTATAYAPYRKSTYTVDLGSIELCKIGDYQDYIYKSGDDWYVHKENNKVVLNGSEDWSLANATTGYTRAVISSVGFPTQLGYCDKLIPRAEGHGAYEYIYFQPTSNGGLYIQIMTERLTADSLDAFKTWLGNNPVVAVYSLITPTDTKITDTDLIAQLKTLWGANSYNDVTNIIVTPTGSNLPALLSVGVYKKSLAGMLGNSEIVAEKLNEVPEMPTVNDATLTIQQNGTNVATFTANSATNTTANITSPVITMTTTDPGEGSPLAANNFVAVYGGDPIIMDYSTTEINTGAKWIDGSAIYKKTINFGALPASGNRTVAHSISNLAYIVDIKAMAYDTGSSRYKALNLPQGNNTDWVVMEADSTNVYAYVGSDFSDTTAYVTLYYTKSS